MVRHWIVSNAWLCSLVGAIVHTWQAYSVSERTKAKQQVSKYNNGRNGSCLTWLATSLEEKRRWLIINASPRGQCSK